MIAAIIFFVTICSICALICVLFNYRFEQSSAIVLFSLILVIYFWGLLDLLPVGAIVVLITGIVAMCAVIVRVVRNHSFSEFRQLFFSPGFLFFVLAFLVILVANYGRLVSNRDDFTHWANTVKWMTLLDRFATGQDSYAQFPNYPPAMSLVQYYLQYINKMFGNDFSEWMLFVAAELAIIMLLLPALLRLEWKRKAVFPALILAFCTCCIPGVLYPDVYRTLMIDPFVGLLAGYAFSILLSTDKRSVLDNIGLTLSCFVVTLTKLPGIYFAACIIVAIALETIIERKDRNIRIFHKASSEALTVGQKLMHSSETKRKVSIARSYATIISSVTATFAAYVSWNFWLDHEGAQRRFSETIDWRIVWQVITGQDTGYRGDVMRAFLKNIFVSRQRIGLLGLVHIEISWFALFLGLIVAAIYISVLLIRKRGFSSKRLYTTLGVLFGACLPYTFGIAVSYLFKFSQTQATLLASFDRYMNISLVMVLTALYRPIAEFIGESEKAGARISAALVFVMLLIAPVKELGSFMLRQNVIYSQEVRAPYAVMVTELPRCITEPDSKICIVTDGNRDLIIQLLNFCMAPITVSDYSDDVLDVSDHDLLFDGFSAEDWKHALKEDHFDFVLIINAPSGFLEKYSEVFLEPDLVAKGAVFSVDGRTASLSYLCNVD